MELFTELAPSFFVAMGVEDEDDLYLALLFWCLSRAGKGTIPEEIARLN